MINIKVKTDIQTFFKWMQTKFNNIPTSINIDNEEYFIHVEKGSLLVGSQNISFIGTHHKKIDFYNYIDDFDEDEGKRILNGLPDNQTLAYGEIIDLGTQGFEIDFQVHQPEFRKTLNSLIDEAKFFWPLSKHDYYAEYFATVEKKDIKESGWVDTALSLYLEGKTPEEICSYFKRQGFSITTKTIRNELSKLRKKYGEDAIPRKAERDRRLVDKPSKK